MTPGEGTDQKPPGARSSLFLERQSYRRRRLTDAARLLPFLGAALLAVPLLWTQTGVDDGTVRTSSAILYVFVCWAVLILVSLIFGIAARRMGAAEETEMDRADGDP